MENKEAHLPLITVTSDKGRDPDTLIAELRERTRKREVAEAAAKKDPMFNLRLALFRGNPNRGSFTWSISKKKKHW